MGLPISVPSDFAAASVEELEKVGKDANTAAQPYIARGFKNLNPEEKETVRGLAAAATQANQELAKRAEQDKADEQTVAVFASTVATAEPTAAAAATTAATEVAATTFAVTEPQVIIPSARTAASQVSGTSSTTTALLTETDRPAFGGFTYAPKLAVDARFKEFNGSKQLGEAVVGVLSGYNGISGFHRERLATFARDYPTHYRGPSEGVGDASAEFALVEGAVAAYQREIADNYASGNQTAAAAYCAPSLTLYDLCELETDSGILPITEIQISRGGIFFTTGPDFASIFNGAGYWNYTEAQIIANTVKPCMEIECPAFTEQRLRNLGLCVTAGILQRRGYPELVARFIRGAMIAHLHRINAFVLAQMAAGSTLVDLDPVPAGSLVNDTTASGLLAAAEMVAVDMRYRNRMNPNANLETVFPIWGMAQLRADVSRRTGVDMISVSDTVIMGWFRDRNLNLRLVYDWQDAYSGVVGGPGTALPGITSFPATIEFMIYPLGTWVKGVDDTIRLDTVYDSVKLSTNQYTAVFTEEGVLVAKVCPDSRRVVYPLCPTGATTELVTRSCA